MEYRPTQIHQLHVFKDVDNTSWKSPQVFTFPLSSESASPLYRAKGDGDGISNLHHCTPDQLSFLSSHLAAENTKLQAARDEAKAKRKAKVAADVSKHKFHRELQQIAAKREKAREEEEESNQPARDHRDHSSRERSISPNLSVSSLPRANHFVRPMHRRARRPGHHPDSIMYGPPIPIVHPEPNFPFPPLPEDLQAEFEARHPPSPPLYSMLPSPTERGSDWTLEAVELDLIPSITRFKLVPARRPTRFGDDPVEKKYPVLSYQVSETGKKEFAVVYRRVVLSNAVSDDLGRNVSPVPRHVNYDFGYEGSAIGYYDGDDEGLAEVRVDEGEVEVEGEEDLEIVAKSEGEAEVEVEVGVNVA